MTSIEAWNSTDGLPRQFLSSLRTLFDILDEKKCGYVRLQDIETRWHEEGVKGLPSGVTDALRKVVPPNGYLSFERFVSGLKLALLTSKTKPNSNPVNEKENIDHKDNQRNKLPSQGPSNSNLQYRQRHTRQKLTSTSLSPDPLNSKNNYDETTNPNVLQNLSNQRPQNINPTATVPPNNVHGHIPTQAWKNPSNREQKSEKSYRREGYPQSAPPPRPDRSPQKSQSELPPKIPPRGNTSKRIISELKNWQQRMHGMQQSKDKSTVDSKSPEQSSAQNEIYVNIAQLNASDHGPTPSSHPSSIKRRDSARRHTLSSGVDTNMIKRAKQLDEEKQILIQGLAMIDKARLWYLKQINLIEEKQKYVGKTSHNDYNLEAMQERMNFEKARIAEVNHQIKTLVDSSEKGFPLHMNLAMTSTNHQLQSTIKVVKDQNKQLTKEISHKSDKITQLEQEKAQLIRDLFEARSSHKTNYDDTTFM
ncbi:suppressor APC domain-containing protein 2-like [Mytilus edulis]|uniref:suppressor APC domain-containing protein 2-like n=1 Tax=Mytilus edulis TaxID=6550 RepID=UPI0039F06797